MVNIIISFLIAITAAVIPWKVFSAEIDMNRVDQLVKKYSNVYERPKSCPMESKNFSDLIDKTEALKEALKGSCTKAEDGRLSEVLSSIKTLQENLQSNAAVTNSDTLSDILIPSSDTAVNGAQFSNVFSNINLMIKKSQCNMDNGRILETASDLIYSSTQLGILAGNTTGLVIAGGGFIVSSALRLIDLIIKQRFDFEKSSDRKTFISLNCSFYEIRRELDIQGALDLENSSTREDFRDTKFLIEKIVLELKASEDSVVNITKANAEIDLAIINENIGDLTELKKILSKIQKYLQPGVTSSLEIPTETQKLLMISQLAQDYNLLAAQIQFYKQLNISSIPLLDDLFLVELKKIDPMNPSVFMEQLNISAKDFNDNYRAKILFHIIRIGADIESREKLFLSKGDKQKLEISAKMDKRKELLLSKLGELRKVENRLGNLVTPKEYSGLDDGSDNMVAILDNHRNISAQLYGEWGDKFLKFATEKSLIQINGFNTRLSFFNKKYSEILKQGKIDKIETSYFCQDIQKLRLLFRQADSIVQQGFDFVATNKDLIYSDVSNGYQGTLNEEEGLVSSGPVVKVQRHYKSVLFAIKKLSGEEISKENTKRYLDKTFFGNYFIGKSMIEVSKTKQQAELIQDIYDQYQCKKSLGADIEF